MTIRRTMCTAGMAVALLGGFGLVRSRAQQEERDAVKLAPELNKLLFENAFVRVTEEKVPPGKGQPKHGHPRSVVVALSDYEVDQKIYPDGHTVHSIRHKGDVNWSEPVVHETQNVGTTLQDAVRIELK